MCAKGGPCDTGKYACDGSDGSGSCSGDNWAGTFRNTKSLFFLVIVKLCFSPPSPPPLNRSVTGVQSYSTCTYAPMAGQQGEGGNYPFVGEVGEVYDFDIWGRGKSAHPMHVHTNKFQVLDVFAVISTNY